MNPLLIQAAIAGGIALINTLITAYNQMREHRQQTGEWTQEEEFAWKASLDNIRQQPWAQLPKDQNF